MRSSKTICLFCAVLAMSVAHAEARHHGAHVHGISHVAIGLEGDRLQLSVEGPEINFVGFEHTPGNETETRELNNAMVDLRVPTRWLVLPAAAGCRQTAIDVASPLADGDGHRNMKASYEYSCASPPRWTPSTCASSASSRIPRRSWSIWSCRADRTVASSRTLRRACLWR
jgi:hypothetical protein